MQTQILPLYERVLTGINYLDRLNCRMFVLVFNALQLLTTSIVDSCCSGAILPLDDNLSSLFLLRFSMKPVSNVIFNLAIEKREVGPVLGQPGTEHNSKLQSLIVVLSFAFGCAISVCRLISPFLLLINLFYYLHSCVQYS